MDAYVHKVNGTVDESTINITKNSYAVEENNHLLGYFNLIPKDEYAMVDYELVEKYRNKGLGKHLLEIVEEFIEENFDYDNILLMIRYDNMKSKVIALDRGYDIDYLLEEDLGETGEMSMFAPYYKSIKKEKQKVLSKY